MSSLPSKIGTVVETAIAYAVHYMSKEVTATPLGVVSIVYTYRKDLQKFAVKHSLNKHSKDSIQNNLLECLQYID